MEEPLEPALDEKTPNHSHKPDDDVSNASKKEAILKACEDRDLAALRELAESPGGFLADSIRQKACKCP